MSKQPIELLFVKNELLSKMSLHCVIPNSNTLIGIINVAHSFLDRKHVICTLQLGNPNRGCSHFPHIFLELMWIFYLVWKQRFSCSLSGNTCSPIMLIIELGMVTILWAYYPISFEHMVFGYPFLEPHITTYHSNIAIIKISYQEKLV